RADGSDGRVQRVFLTKTGKDLKEKLIPCAQEVLTKSGRNLSKEDVAKFKLTLNQILKNLE
ncbi:MAG TPA: hypothetical protein VJM08_12915, partial [Anaerolineales bacterium]|nr:hypothetical protein [Anaerolineales bacterium]